LPVAEALPYAIRIATCLRDLHTQGLIYGAVSSQLILLGQSGAALRGIGGRAQIGDGREDVKGFGTVLSEMLRRIEGSQELRAEMDSLAVRCKEEAPDMRQVLILLRLLRLRQSLVVVRSPVLVPRAEPAPKKRRGRLRIHIALHWKPLAHLAALAFSGK
jgi:hypothetical protein